MATVTVDPNTNFQTIVGWEAVQEIGSLEFLQDYPNWNNAVLDMAVDDIGINRIRTEIPTGHIENSADAYGSFLADGLNAADNPTKWTAVGNQQDNSVNDNADPNVINASGFKWSWIDQQIDTVVAPMKAKLAARGETLFWNMCVVNFDNPSFHKTNQAEYAEMILATWQHINTKYGYLPDALEIWLEPDNIGTPQGSESLTASEMSQMIGLTRDRLVNAGFAKPYIIAPSFLDGSNARQMYLDIKALSATNAGYLNEISYHRYGGLNDTQYAQLLATAQADGKNTAMLEWINATHINLYEDLTKANVSAWEQYALAYPGTQDGSKLMNIGAGPGFAVTLCVRTKYLRHYFKYARKGAVRKGVANESANFQGVPFVNPNGKWVVPIKCTASGTIDVVGLPAGTYGIRYTTGDGATTIIADDAALSNQTVNGSQNVTFSIPAAGVATVFDIDYLQQPPSGPVPAGGPGNRLLFMR